MTQSQAWIYYSLPARVVWVTGLPTGSISSFVLSSAQSAARKAMPLAAREMEEILRIAWIWKYFVRIPEQGPPRINVLQFFP
jgi:hypothetical protein